MSERFRDVGVDSELKSVALFETHALTLIDI